MCEQDTYDGGTVTTSHSDVTDCPLLPHFSRFIYKRSTDTENRADRPPTRLKIHSTSAPTEKPSTVHLQIYCKQRFPVKTSVQNS